MEIKKVITIIMGCFLILAFILLPDYIRLRQIREHITQLSEENLRIKQKNRTLQEDIKRFESDPFYRIGVAKEQLKVLDEGERVYKIQRETEDIR
jgi:cell division protein FtsB